MGYIVNNKDYQLRTESLRVKNVVINNNEENVAFVLLEEEPEFKLQLANRNIKTAEETIKEEIFSSIDDHISGISILGGEPLCKENYDTVLNLCKDFKAAFPNKTIWLWTGYTLDAVPAEILNYIDVLIDGQFIQEKYDYNLKWRGSSNQRILRKRFDFP